MAKPTRWLVLLSLAVAAALVGAWWWPAPSPELPGSPGAIDGDAPERSLGDWQQQRSGLELAPCRIRGRVTLSEDGTGATGAVVMLRMAHYLDARAIDPFVLKAGDGGEWSLEEVPPGRYNITATLEGHRPAIVRQLELQPGKDHADVDLVLETGGIKLTGTLTTQDGAAVAGARIEAIALHEMQVVGAPTFGTESDDAGRYTFSLDPDAYILYIVHPDFVPAQMRARLSGRDRIRDIVLTPGGVIEGRVLSRAEGKPVERAEVTLQDPLLLAGGSPAAAWATRTMTDAEGRFTLRGLAAGVTTLQARAARFSSAEPKAVPLGVGERVDGVELLVDPGYTISGFLVAEGSETVGIGGALVIAVDSRTFAQQMVGQPSGPDGSFELRGMRPGRYWMMALGEGVIPSFGTVTLDVEDRDVTDTLIRLDRGAYIRGRVEPPASVYVRASIGMVEPKNGTAGMNDFMKSMMSTIKATRSEPDGTFVYGPVAPGSYALDFQAGDGRWVRHDVEMAGEDLTGIVVKLGPAREVSGRVVDSEGQPVPSVTVAAHEHTAVQRMAMSEVMGSSAHEDLTDADGRFTLRGLQPGEYTISARDDMLLRYPWAEPEDPQRPMQPRKIVVGERSVHEIELVINPARSIVGVITDPQQKPVENAWVTVWPQLTTRQWGDALDSGTASASMNAAQMGDENQGVLDELMRQVGRAYAPLPVLTDAAGRFEVAGLRGGPYSMVAEAQRGTLRAEARSIPAGTTVALTLQGLATIEANVTGGQPPEGQLRVVLQGAEQRMETAAASAPTVTVERLLPGHYQLEISAEGGVATTEVDVSAREHVRLEMPLRKWGRVSGQILDVRTEQPLAGVALISAGTPKTMGEILAGASNMMALMSGSAENTTDADGKFEIGQLPVGESLVQFMCTTPSLALCGVVHVDLQSEQHQELGVVHGLGNATDSTSLGTLGVELGTPRPEPEQRRILTVNDLDASGPARRAGIRKGDRVLSIDGIEVERIGAQVARRLLQGDRLQTGEMRTLVLERGGNQLTVRVQAKAGDG